MCKNCLKLTFPTYPYNRKEMFELYEKLKPVYNMELKRFIYVRDCFLSHYGCTNPVNGALKELDAIFEQLEDSRMALEEIYSQACKMKKNDTIEIPYPTYIANRFIVGYKGILESFAIYYNMKHDFHPLDRRADMIALAIGAKF